MEQNHHWFNRTIKRALSGWWRFSLVILLFGAVNLFGAGMSPGFGGLGGGGALLLLLAASLVGAFAVAAVSPPDSRGLPQRRLLAWGVGGAVTTATWTTLMVPWIGIGDDPVRNLCLVSLAGAGVGLIYGVIVHEMLG